MTYGAPGHSTNLEACCWVGFDVAERVWKLITKPLPTPVVNASLWQPGVYPPARQFDATWGDWTGDSSDWPEAFRQPGYNPPMGSHTRNSFVYIPPADAGNARGKIVVAWQPTGNCSGTGLRGSWVWDADTGLFSRTANLRPSHGSDVTGIGYSAAHRVVIGHNFVSTSTSGALDYLDLSNMTWVRRNASTAVVVRIDSTNFIIGDLFVMVRHEPSGPVPMTFWAAPISAVKAGAAWNWTQLTVDATSWPTKNGSSWTVSWSRCPVNGAFYAVNRVAGSNLLWKLSPPAADDQTGALLAGRWQVTAEALGGNSLIGADFDYSRLRWSTALGAFLWFGESVTSAVQAIRPGGV
ncbi:MAG: hypothetical protein KF863_13085 [Rubrivivax sp.]|nr:hypothetical protein [Rubrivivax sp.]